jgi:hypothetical protein
MATSSAVVGTILPVQVVPLAQRPAVEATIGLKTAAVIIPEVLAK